MPVDRSTRRSFLRRIKAKISRLGLDALLVSDVYDVLYLLGYSSSPPAKLLIPRKGRAVYFTDPLNETLARKKITDLAPGSIVAGKDPLEMLKTFLRDNKIKKLGINEGSLSMREYRTLAALGRKLDPADASSVVEEMRKIKKAHEVAIIRKAARETVSIWKEVRKKIRTGMSEKDIAAMINVCIHSRGYDNSFPPIVSTGKNSAYPHAFPTDRRLHKDEHVLVDFGIRYSNYCSDLTRTWDNGRIDRQIRDFRKLVMEAHDRAIEQIKAGVFTGDLARKINRYFSFNNVKQFVLHGLGHGLGLFVHEKPFLNENSRERFRENMVVTVEPGLYREGLGGIREEDMVLVTKKGCEVLTA
ncbi:MAG: Xaa-Pro peptidase family protein [Candidatus Omnitrophota bacterium]|nr:Xaa-Pro peptidase family protein [Candidatus Omnitrophota bacterium]